MDYLLYIYRQEICIHRNPIRILMDQEPVSILSNLFYYCHVILSINWTREDGTSLSASVIHSQVSETEAILQVREKAYLPVMKSGKQRGRGQW